ncbi:MAG: hypothetical protein LBF16_03440 [Pseudomonadales bacterium]|nr:hypothetical protein [Pseudomonadales bacterium]
MKFGNKVLEGLGGWISNIGAIISILLTVSVAVIAVLKSGSTEPASTLAWTVIASLAILFIYFLIHYKLIRELSKANNAQAQNILRLHLKLKEAQERLGKIKEQLEAEKKSTNHLLSDTMIQVSRQRGKFDDQLFEMPYFNKPIDMDKTRKALETLLQRHCDAAVTAMIATKGGSDSDFQASIKFMFRDKNTGGKYHRCWARSSKSHMERKAKDQLNSIFLVDQNKCMHDVLYRGGEKYAIIENVTEYVRAMRDEHGDTYSYPDYSCSRYYNNLIMVPISGPTYKRSIKRKFPEDIYRHVDDRVNNGGDIIGFLSVDSKNFLFDMDRDLGTLKELAAETYSAYQQYEFFRTAPFARGAIGRRKGQSRRKKFPQNKSGEATTRTGEATART